MNIGLFLSEGGGEISRVVNLKSLAGHFKKDLAVEVLPDVHSAAGMKSIRRAVEERKLEGVVLAGESPLYYRRLRNAGLVLEMLQSLGINSNRIGLVNLKEQVALPHRSEPAEATKKARVLVESALEKIRLSHPVGFIEVAPKKTVAVFGLSPGGLFAAQRLLDRGFKVLFFTSDPIQGTPELPQEVRPTFALLENHPEVGFYSAPLEDFYGYAGNFRIRLGGPIDLRAGGVIVAIGEDPAYMARLSPFIRIEKDAQGRFRNLLSETALTETAQPGIFLIPHGLKTAESPAYADSAAICLDSLLGRSAIHHELFVSEVDAEVCGGCGTCIKTCIFRAAELDPVKKLSSTNIKRCVGCGNCVSACPTGARDQVSAGTRSLLAAIKILASYTPPNGVRLLYLLCEGCGYPSLDEAGREGIEYPTSVLPLSVRCAGRIDTQFILEAFHEGFDGVVICKCGDDHCLNLVGNIDLDRRANLFRAVLASRGIDPDRLRIINVTECGGVACLRSTVEFVSLLGKKGSA